MKFPKIFFFVILGLSCVSFATAKDGDIIKRGQCSNGIKTKLKASPENGQIEVEYELDNAAPNELWQITLRKNGTVILRTNQRTNSFGDLEVRKVTPNGSGSERIDASARRSGASAACPLSLVVGF
jgi:hypothetical protein